MLNETHVEGIVTKVWTFGDTRFVRLACYPDPGRALKRSGGREEPDYLTLRCEGAHALAASALAEGTRLRAHGHLVSRDYDIPLARFAEAAAGDEAGLKALRELVAAYGDKVRKPHVLNEVIVERLNVTGGPA